MQQRLPVVPLVTRTTVIVCSRRSCFIAGARISLPPASAPQRADTRARTSGLGRTVGVEIEFGEERGRPKFGELSCFASDPSFAGFTY